MALAPARLVLAGAENEGEGRLGGLVRAGKMQPAEGAQHAALDARIVQRRAGDPRRDRAVGAHHEADGHAALEFRVARGGTLVAGAEGAIAGPYHAPDLLRIQPLA